MKYRSQKKKKKRKENRQNACPHGEHILTGETVNKHIACKMVTVHRTKCGKEGAQEMSEVGYCNFKWVFQAWPHCDCGI